MLFDVQGIQSPAHGERGIARYLVELAAALEAGDERPASYLLNPDLALPASLEPLAATGRLEPLDRADYSRATVYHVGSPIELTTPIDRIWPRQARGLQLAVHVYDLIPLLLAESYLERPGPRRAYLARLELLRRADRILAISRTTAGDVVEHLGVAPDRVATVGTGVSAKFQRPRSLGAARERARRRMPWLEDRFLLYTGGLDLRKNLLALLEAYAAIPVPLRAAHQLVVVCRLDDVDRIEVLDRRLDELALRGRVRLAGWVPDEELILLYQACELFVFPSLYEGYGLPIAEAIACGAPVVASGTSSMLELVSDPTAVFDPRDPRSIARTLERTLGDPAALARLRAARLPTDHRWDAVAGRVAAVYRELAPRRPRIRRRRRIAYVSPMPPQRSGVATYSHRLLERLAGRCEVDVFVDEAVIEEVRAPYGVDLRPLEQLEAADRAVGGYNRIVYCLGNSPFHTLALAMLRRVPGIVIAHDVRLSSLYEWSNRKRPDLEPRRLRKVLRTMYGNTIPRDLGSEGYVSSEEGERYGVLMAREAIRLADRYLVHSMHAAQLARLDAAPADTAKIAALPFGVESPDAFPPRVDGGLPPVVASFGWVAEMKQPDKILDAFPSILERHPDATLALVGPVTGSIDPDMVRDRARTLGIADRFVLTGEVDDSAFRDWMARATVAIQLRSGSNGESSASVAECLAAGIPTVVTAIGSARELPDACVAKVERDVDPDVLGGVVSDLVDDAERRAAMSTAGRAWARANSFERAAEGLFAELF